MKDRAVTQTRKDRAGDILALCNQQEGWSPRMKGDAIRDTETGVHRDYVPWTDGQSTWIQVVNGPNGKYLRSAPPEPPALDLTRARVYYALKREIPEIFPGGCYRESPLSRR